MTQRRASFSEAEVRRAMKAAKKEGFKVIELTPTAHGLKIVARIESEPDPEELGKLD